MQHVQHPYEQTFSKSCASIEWFEVAERCDFEGQSDIGMCIEHNYNNGFSANNFALAA